MEVSKYRSDNTFKRFKMEGKRFEEYSAAYGGERRDSSDLEVATRNFPACSAAMMLKRPGQNKSLLS